MVKEFTCVAEWENMGARVRMVVGGVGAEGAVEWRRERIEREADEARMGWSGGNGWWGS